MHERNLCSQGTVLPEPGCETFLSHAHKTRFHWSVSLSIVCVLRLRNVKPNSEAYKKKNSLRLHSDEVEPY